jgi:hypothetical protein
MASNIDILLDKAGGLLNGGAAPYGVLPSFTRNDVYPFRIRVLERNATGAYTDAILSSPSFSLGIGNIDAVPTDGQFKLTTTTGTSTAISFNATTAQVLSAVSGIAGNVSVTTYGSGGSSWIITAATANTALSFGGQAFTLFPTSGVQVNTRRAPTASVFAQQIISLVRSPSVFANSFSSVSGDGIALTKIQDGSASTNETYALAVGNDVYGGSYSLAYGGYSVGIDYNQTATNVATILSAITGIGSGNISVQSDSKRGLIISFVNGLGLQNVSTALTLDSSGVRVYNWYSATVTMSTSEIEELFNESGETTITPTLEIEMTESGQTKTLLQYNSNITKDLILTGTLVPASVASYYTAAQCNSLFIANSITNVDATNRTLVDSTGTPALDWENRHLVDSNYSNIINFTNGVQFDTSLMGFYGQAVTAKPTGTNIVSGLTNIGIIGYTQPTAVNVVSALNQTGLLVNNNTSTFGVLPLSSRTLTTTASIYFGLVGSNSTNSVSVVVTGCQINDIVLIGLPASNPNGLSFNGHATTANGLEVDCINATNANITPATATYRITVIGY